MLKDSTIKQIQKLLQKGATRTQIAQKIQSLEGLGRTQGYYWARELTEEIEFDSGELVKRVTDFPKGKEKAKTKALEIAPRGKKATVTYKGDSGVAESMGSRVKSLEDLIVACDIDKEVWAIKSYIANCWESTFEGQPITLYQVKANLEKKKEELYGKKLLQEFISNAEKYAPKKWDNKTVKKNGKYALYIAAADSHVGKECYKECGTEYNLNNVKDIYNNAINDLMSRVPEEEIDEVLYLVGSDFFHSEASKLETTSGTRIEGDSNWQKVFKVGCEILTENISKIAQKHKIHVVVVLGNHSKSTEYYLGCYLEAWFKHNKNVTIDNSPVDRKYYTYGCSLICNLHGDAIKEADIPLVVIRESGLDITKYHNIEVFRGHTHLSASKEIQGVTLHTIKALCPSDAWHDKRGYWGKKGAEAFLFDKDYGLIANFIYNYV